MIWDKEGEEDTVDEVATSLFEAAEGGDEVKRGRSKSKKRRDKKKRHRSEKDDKKNDRKAPKKTQNSKKKKKSSSSRSLSSVSSATSQSSQSDSSKSSSKSSSAEEAGKTMFFLGESVCAMISFVTSSQVQLIYIWTCHFVLWYPCHTIFENVKLLFVFEAL